MLEEPNEIVVHWFNRQPAQSLWTTSITIFEVHFGIERLASGKRQKELNFKFNEVLREDLNNRILLFDTAAAERTAALAAKRYKIGRVVDFNDTAIAGIALSQHAKIVTRNTRHFADLNVEIINPWRHAN